ncbi:MAG TPA: hypothetical protein VGD60_10125 [Candidatus Acidoferrales bacterium]
MKPYRNSHDPEGKFALTTPQNPEVYKLPNLCNAVFDELQEVRRRAVANANRAAAEAPQEFAEPEVAEPQPQPISAFEPVIEAFPIATAEPEPQFAPEPQPANEVPEVPAESMAEVPEEVPEKVLEEVLAVPEKPAPPRPYRDPETALERHARKCIICNHPDREAIELDYIHWRRAESIAKEFGFHFRNLYRHAYATGLHQDRRRNVGSALELLIEDAAGVRTTAGDIIKAVRAFAHINDRGEWQNPPNHLIMSSGNQLNVSIQNPVLPRAAALNSQNGKPAIDVGPTRESAAPSHHLDPISNRHNGD